MKHLNIIIATILVIGCSVMACNASEETNEGNELLKACAKAGLDHDDYLYLHHNDHMEWYEYMALVMVGVDKDTIQNTTDDEGVKKLLMQRAPSMGNALLEACTKAKLNHKDYLFLHHNDHMEWYEYKALLMEGVNRETIQKQMDREGIERLLRYISY
jgi:hypothetical protein